MRRLLLVLLLLTTPALAQVDLSGKMVLLVVTDEREDAQAKQLEAPLLRLRERLGLSKSELPFVFMGFQDPLIDRSVFGRLGFSVSQNPVVCVVRWGTPASAGPSHVVNGAIRRQLSKNPEPALVGLLRDWLQGTDRAELATRLPGPTFGKLSLKQLDVQAHGEPLNLMTLTTQLINDSSAASRPVSLEFRVQTNPDEPWSTVALFSIGAVKPGALAKKGTVVSLKDYPELVRDGQVLDFKGRLLIESETIFEGSFVQGHWQPQEDE
ncbi:MAG: hypothetical protein AB7S38_27500 [Vulcanimicrobiota bacterium]